MFDIIKLGLAAACVLAPVQARAQTPMNMTALKGLAPVATLATTFEGRAALAANLTVTGGIQTGAIAQPTLMPFAEQQQQALRDAFITDGNLAQLADGLGTTLGAAYQARAHYIDREHYTNMSAAVADLIAYTNATTGAIPTPASISSPTGTTDGKTPVSDDAGRLLKANGGDHRLFGKRLRPPSAAARAPTPTATRVRSRPNRPSCRSSGPTTSTCRPTTRL